MQQPTFPGFVCKRSGCSGAPYQRTGLCRPCYLKRDYRSCNQCGAPRHKRSESGLCVDCYWTKRRAESRFTGMSRQEYDAQRYDAATRRAHFLKVKYGLTVERYLKMYEEQDGVCAVCRTPFSEAKLTHGAPVIDHCHRTGAVRGLLCDLCNRGLGQLRDDPVLLLRAYEYLRKADGHVLDPVDRLGDGLSGD